MEQRPGVVNMHLAVDMSLENTMKMLYKIGPGFVKEDHYGIALARVAGLPPRVLETAERVSKALIEQAASKKQSSKSAALSKRRKLVLGLKEALQQAENGPMQGNVLLDWLRRLQDEFIDRMENIENDVAVNDTEGTVVEELEEDEEMHDVDEEED